MPPVQPPLRAVPRNPVPGPHNRQAEDEPARLHCLLDEPGMQFTTSGRAAILLGLEALGLAPTDRVLVPSYHCPTMVSPAIALGQPVGFYPIDTSGRPQLDWLEQHAPADTRGLCAAHYFGLPLDLRPIKAWCESRGVLMLATLLVMKVTGVANLARKPSSAAVAVPSRAPTLGNCPLASLPENWELSKLATDLNKRALTWGFSNHV